MCFIFVNNIFNASEGSVRHVLALCSAAGCAMVGRPHAAGNYHVFTTFFFLSVKCVHKSGLSALQTLLQSNWEPDTVSVNTLGSGLWKRQDAGQSLAGSRNNPGVLKRRKCSVVIPENILHVRKNTAGGRRKSVM